MAPRGHADRLRRCVQSRRRNNRRASTVMTVWGLAKTACAAFESSSQTTSTVVVRLRAGLLLVTTTVNEPRQSWLTEYVPEYVSETINPLKLVVCCPSMFP